MSRRATKVAVSLIALFACASCNGAAAVGKCPGPPRSLNEDLLNYDEFSAASVKVIAKIGDCYYANPLHGKYNYLEFRKMRRRGENKLYVFSFSGITNLRMVYEVDKSGNILTAYETSEPYMKFASD